MTELCEQCHHPVHTKAVESAEGDGEFSFTGGCPIMVYLEPIEGGGYYHEHCDCDGGS